MKNSRLPPFTLPLLALSVAAGCTGEAPERPVPVADMQELMVSVMEPAAEAYWDGVGEVLTEAGVHQFRPLTEEDWTSLRNAAFVLAESGSLMMMDGRARDRGDWMDHSRTMVEAGRLALDAVDRRNPDAVFDAGAEVYYACRDCHARYAAETLRPSDPHSAPGPEEAPDPGADVTDAADLGDGR
ncbi:hypothetical protein [Candidatus Palauibacter soopunensis]|uniref:hypothetical protein n=1 Tax=Candidatus Palauibacter soopunensis TaxID=3056739 RepID=UPI00238D1301|nr:hypothetical protein [Candidatus Palauibacter soopunensis]MDE2879341.1 hypothetical protein [Candidatus Palauibacter soopunensis]